MNKEVTLKKKKLMSINTIAKIGVLSAMAGLIMLVEFPLPFAPPFYKLDFSELPVLIGAFALGPIAGMMIEFIKILINFILNGTITGGVGEIANFLIGCSFIMPAAIIYAKKKTMKRALIGLLIGTICLTIVGAALNYYILVPVYATVFGADVATIVAMGTAVNSNIDSLLDLVLIAVVPFNLVKGSLISGLTLMIYKRVSGILHS